MTTTEHPLAPDEIMAFVDGELSADRTQSVSAHVGQCPECTALVSELRDLSVQMAVWQVDTEETYRRLACVGQCHIAALHISSVCPRCGFQSCGASSLSGDHDPESPPFKNGGQRV